jgi:glyoxylase-like metal-dependent hydrolase (beta-lactamase superfamily II)
VGRIVLSLSLKVLRNTRLERPERLVYVMEGDDLAAYGINAKIIELPGHTHGSIGIDVDGTHMFVGDALDNWVRPGIGHLYHDRDEIVISAEKIRNLGDRTVYYGHGNPTKNGKF